jgi:RNA polymerase sigma factor (sigma-70 family)
LNFSYFFNRLSCGLETQALGFDFVPFTITAQRRRKPENLAPAMEGNRIAAPMSSQPSTEAPVTWNDVRDLMDALKMRAHELLAREGNAGTVHTTQLVNSALKKLTPKARDWLEIEWKDRKAFFKDANFAMRRCLIDYARRRHRRGHVQVGNFETEAIASLPASSKLDFDRVAWDAAERVELAQAVDAALNELDKQYPGKDLAAVVELRVFEGLGQSEIARMLGVTDRTVRNYEKLAYALLRQALQPFFSSE